MQIVIDISDEAREKVFDIINDGSDFPLGLQSVLLNAIANGTVLPEGHGRLIDVDKIKCWLTEQNIRVVSKWQLDNALTILDAEMESKNDTY